MKILSFAAMGGLALLLSACNLSSTQVAAGDEVLATSSNGAPNERHFNAFLTGYSYWDNTPPGSAAIARPVVHRRAGGTGTYQDPITIAVGYRLEGGRSVLDYPAGTRFYLPQLRRYAIVEDICGEGPTPHLTGCAKGRQGLPHLDIYVDGSRGGAAPSESCMRRLTRAQPIIQNPARGYPVVAGALTESGCQVFQG